MDTAADQGEMQLEDEEMENSNDTQTTEAEGKDDIIKKKEMLLIKLVYQEPSLYNPANEQYRNMPCKEAKWNEISQQLGWNESYVKNKWKAMRDQYCRELKRIKYSQKHNIKWKYFKDLEFLRPFALSRSYRPRVESLRKPNTPTPDIQNALTSNCDPYLGNIGDAIITIKNEPTDINGCTTRVITTTLNNEQLSSVNWGNYLNVSGATQTNNDNHQHSILTHHPDHQQHNNNDFIFSTFVNPLTNATVQTTIQQHEHQSHDGSHQRIALNVVEATAIQPSPAIVTQTTTTEVPTIYPESTEIIFERELIALVKEKDIIYNACNVNYRNLKRKKDVWMHIAKTLQKTEKQCRQKWKALRDQYIREHKRLKDRQDVEFLPRWKHYDALNFLKQYIRHRSDLESGSQLMETSELEAGIEEQLNNESSLDMVNSTEHKNVALIPLHGVSTLSSHVTNASLRLTTNTTNDGATESTSLCVPSNFGDIDLGPYIINENPGLNIGDTNENSNMDEECEEENEEIDEEDLEGNDIGDGEAEADGDDNGGVEDHEGMDDVEDDDEDLNENGEIHQRTQELFDQFEATVGTKLKNADLLSSQNNSESTDVYNIPSDRNFTEIKLPVSSNTNTQNSNTFSNALARAPEVIANDQTEFIADQQKNHFANIDKKNFLSVTTVANAAPCTKPVTKLIASLDTNQNPPQIQVRHIANNIVDGDVLTGSNDAVVSESSLNLNLNCNSNSNSNSNSNLNSKLNFKVKTPTPTLVKTPTFKRLIFNNNDEDEIDIFFKAVAMKIRKANIPPNDLTNLQIQVLKLINEHLGN